LVFVGVTLRDCDVSVPGTANPVGIVRALAKGNGSASACVPLLPAGDVPDALWVLESVALDSGCRAPNL
jgi:hypothetical protein